MRETVSESDGKDLFFVSNKRKHNLSSNPGYPMGPERKRVQRAGL
jgi:hypothetical protein